MSKAPSSARKWRDAQQITVADAGWQAAMRKRGYDSFDTQFLRAARGRLFRRPCGRGRRLVRVICSTPRGAAPILGRPIEGLYAVVDLDERTVARVVDTGPVRSARPAGLDGGLQPAFNAVPAGANFSADGHQIAGTTGRSTTGWMARRAHSVVGTGTAMAVMSGWCYYRGSRRRDLRPYMDPDKGWIVFARPLGCRRIRHRPVVVAADPGIDCPANAAFFDASLPNDRGEP